MAQTFTAADWTPFVTIATAIWPLTHTDSTAVVSATETALSVSLTAASLWLRYTVPNRLGDTPLAPAGLPWPAWGALLGRIPDTKDLLSTLTDTDPPQLTIRMGRYRATLATQPVPATLEDTPWLDETALVSGSWDATTLDALKRRHQHACTTDASRPALGHWHWIYDPAHQAWQVTTTDGARLIRSFLPAAEPPHHQESWLVPRTLWPWLEKIARAWPAQPIAWTVTPHYLRFQCGGLLLALPRPALPFPDVDTVLWPRLITSVPETTTTLDRAPLHDALGRLLRWIDQDSEQPAQLACTGDQWHLTWQARDGSLALDEWGLCGPVAQAWSAPFAPRLLADLVQGVSTDTITLTFAPQAAPPFLRLTAADDPLTTTSVLLPVRQLAPRQEVAS